MKLLKFQTYSGYAGGGIDKREENFLQKSGSLFFHEPRMNRTGHDMRDMKDMRDMSIGTFSRNLP